MIGSHGVNDAGEEDHANNWQRQNHLPHQLVFHNLAEIDPNSITLCLEPHPEDVPCKLDQRTIEKGRQTLQGVPKTRTALTPMSCSNFHHFCLAIPTDFLWLRIKQRTSARFYFVVTLCTEGLEVPNFGLVPISLGGRRKRSPGISRDRADH